MCKRCGKWTVSHGPADRLSRRAAAERRHRLPQPRRPYEIDKRRFLPLLIIGLLWLFIYAITPPGRGPFPGHVNNHDRDWVGVHFVEHEAGAGAYLLADGRRVVYPPDATLPSPIVWHATGGARPKGYRQGPVCLELGATKGGLTSVTTWVQNVFGIPPRSFNPLKPRIPLYKVDHVGFARVLPASSGASD